jgi:hypothetical protein
MTKLQSHQVVACCGAGCPKYAVTGDQGDLPKGWTFRLVPGDDDTEVRMLTFCEACSTKIEATHDN